MFDCAASASKNVFVVDTNFQKFEVSAYDEKDARKVFKRTFSEHIMLVLGDWEKLKIKSIKKK